MIKSVMESNTGVGKKVNKWLDKNGIKPPYSDEDIAAAVKGLAKDGDNTGPIRKLVSKTILIMLSYYREVYNTINNKISR